MYSSLIGRKISRIKMRNEILISTLGRYKGVLPSEVLPRYVYEEDSKCYWVTTTTFQTNYSNLET